MKAFLFFIFQFVVFAIGAYAQSYSTNPSVGTYGSCPTTNYATSSCGYAYYGNGVQRAKVTSISGSVATFTGSKCAGGTYSTGSIAYLKQSTSSSVSSLICGTVVSQVNVGGLSSFNLTYNLGATNGTKYYVIVVLSGSDNKRYYSNTISVTTTGSSSSCIPLYSQQNAAWSSGVLCPTSYSVGNYGCAMTCMAMLMGTTTTVTPGTLNTYLCNNGGYNSLGYIVWSVADNFDGNGTGIEYYTSFETDNAWTSLDSHLAAGRKVVLNVPFSGSPTGHWVLCTQKNGASGVGSSYKVYDPWTGSVKTMANFGSTFYAARVFSGAPSCAFKSVGDNEFSSENMVSLSPNPASTQAMLTYTLSTNSSAIMYLYDMTGKQLISSDLGTMDEGVHEYSFDTSTLPKGIYLVSLQTEQGTITQKLMVQ